MHCLLLHQSDHKFGAKTADPRISFEVNRAASQNSEDEYSSDFESDHSDDAEFASTDAFDGSIMMEDKLKRMTITANRTSETDNLLMQERDAQDMMRLRSLCRTQSELGESFELMGAIPEEYPVSRNSFQEKYSQMREKLVRRLGQDKFDNIYNYVLRCMEQSSNVNKSFYVEILGTSDRSELAVCKEIEELVFLESL